MRAGHGKGGGGLKGWGGGGGGGGLKKKVLSEVHFKCLLSYIQEHVFLCAS